MDIIHLKSVSTQRGTDQSSFIVIIPHERLASAQDTILEYLDKNETITNKKARELYAVGTQYIMRKILAGMVENGLIEKVEGTQRGGFKYKKVTK